MEIENEQKSGGLSAICIVEEKSSVEQFMEPNSDCCIYRLPQYLFQINKAAYTPNLISIGPLHYGNKELMRMESQKERHWKLFQERIGERSPQVLEEFKTYILNEEQFIRANYSVTSNFSTAKYVKIILRDVVFIMELFLRNHEEHTNDFLLTSPMAVDIATDLLLVENQLPYSVINYLYSKVFPSGGGNPSFFELLQRFLGGYSLFQNVSFSESQTQFKHFTDFLRCALVMEAKLELTSGYGFVVDLPCVTKLKNSGLKFKGAKDKSLLEIQLTKTKKYGKWLQWFEANELQIPTLEIYDQTEILLRNAMAWESFHYPKATHICNYVDLMDQLIDTKEDVDLFVEKGIIVNNVGDNEVIANMFNKLCSNISVSRSCYYKIAEDIKTHHKNPWNHAKATLKSVYFSNLWTGTATVAATFLLVLTVIQTVCSLVQLKQKF